jgi:asparagine synthase (glutamine-hydrolysing)
MCGIVGFLDSSFTKETATDILGKMACAILHRGPDDMGVWFDENAQIGLGHRRLSIVDLSPAGHQPMASSHGRFEMAFNGEIYNHLKLRAELEQKGAIEWRGHSDTETLLAGFEAWGIEATIKKSIGMFAIAVWDNQNQTLTLIRDRMGEKPLYYGWHNGSLIFGSELRALKQHPLFIPRVDRNALALLLRYNTIPAPYSIYEGISKLPPGCLLTVQLGEKEGVLTTYWSGIEAVENGVTNRFKGSADEAVNGLESLLMDAVGQQMMADVPLGAFLSGGVDSSAIVALMQAQSANKVKTFSIGFHEKGYNEAEFAKEVARHLGTEHTELYVTAQDALEVVPSLPKLYDEPFSDSSQIPTYLVSKMAKQHVTVALSGDAGDELFGGYSRYTMTDGLWHKLSKVPLGLRKLLGLGISAISTETLNSVLSLTPLASRYANIGDKLHKGANVLGSKNISELYMGMVSHERNPESWILNSHEPETLSTGSTSLFNGLNPIETMMALDMLTYLPNDILTKVDRAAMGVSLETRVPFLDHRVVEFAWSLPLEYKLRNGVGKWALREVLYKHIPKSLIDRPKMGFGVPLREWLRGPLKDWAEALLEEKRLRDEGFFNVPLVRKKWEEHLSGRRNWQYQLWDVLMFQAWLDEQ